MDVRWVVRFTLGADEHDRPVAYVERSRPDGSSHERLGLAQWGDTWTFTAEDWPETLHVWLSPGQIREAGHDPAASS
jgi:hypothetical protein